GYSGIAVTNGRVYTLDRQTKPREVERILCFRADTGKLQWAHEYTVAYNKLDYGTGPRSTPTLDRGKEDAFVAVCHLHCHDAQSGKVIWSVDAVKDYKGRLPTWGHACSPLVDGRRLVVQIGGQPDACVVAFDKDSGKEIWRSLADPPGYSSPIIVNTGAGKQVVYW